MSNVHPNVHLESDELNRLGPEGSVHPGLNVMLVQGQEKSFPCPGLHKLWYPGIRDKSTRSKFGAHGEHGDVFLFSNLGAL